jgi:hypothetical protein
MDKEYVEYTKEIHLLQDENNSMHLPQTNYEDCLNHRKQNPKNEPKQETLSFIQYRMFVDALQNEMHKKYDLRPRKKEVIQDSQPHPKNPSPS